MSAAAGALSPVDAAQETLQTGIHHLSESLELILIKNIFGGLLLSAAGLLSLTLATGFSGLAEDNPGMTRLLQGATFPIGLVLVYLAGAELFTGYPMWYAMTALARRGRPIQYFRGLITSWLGNLIGGLLFSIFFTFFSEGLAQEPWRSGVVSQVKEDIQEQWWYIIFLRATGCGYLVTFAMFLGTQNQDGISKALSLHLPFFISTAAKFPHTVEYMYLVSTGMLLGADMSVGEYLWKCLLPITLGNTVGGAVFTGAYLWWVYLRRADGANNNTPDRWESG
ncbi:MAG: hypothetical protein M1822_007324 [Bathelium mastoideum]|nr:MAG: hypothetical protein M1822_007324 [Bathelium mastoideum]